MMSAPLQLAMAISPAHRNQYLFSDHYLDNLLPDDPRWKAGRAEAQEFLSWLQDLYAREQDQLPDYNETQLEEHWFKPILSQLGHVFERQAGVPGLDRDVKRPDYVFFPDEEARRAAVRAQNTDDYAAQALAVGEVKRWDLPLGKKQKGGGASFEAQNPSWQIDYYLRATGLDWGLLSNGRLWRLVHKDSSQRLSIHYEVDLVDLLSRGEADTLRYFTLFFHQAAFGPDPQGRVFLDDVLAASNAYAVALEEDLEENVYRALEHLMQGFLDLPANGLGPDDLRAIYDNSLYLLYRLLFILYAESRGLLPLDRAQYREQYSLMSIKADIARGDAPGAPMTTIFWGRLKTLFHIINGDDPELNRYLGVPRYNGGLFDPELHPFLEEKAVGDRALVAAVDLLSRRVTGAGREFVDYRTLGVRHLGSIYEGLLEYQPRYAAEVMVAVHDNKGDRWAPAGQAASGARVMDRRDAGQVYLETDRGERKATGSYYTPQYIVEYIVDNTLGPLVDEATERVKARAKEAKGKAARAQAEQSLADEILSLKVADPAMGSGHFLVEATDYLALALATDPYLETEVSVEEDLVYWKRLVVERCIYGVDKNPLAVELAKLSLWLATVAADRPLSFLDHHLQCGDSLIGARVSDLGWAPSVVLSQKAQKQLEAQKAGQMNMFEYLLSQQLPVVMGRILEITEVESDSYETVQAKEATDQAVRELKAPFLAVANLWVSAYFGNQFAQGDYDEALGLIGKPVGLLAIPAVEQALEMGGERDFFHWELAFPEVFYDRYGQPLGDNAGFHAVVGNPPYINIKRQLADESSYVRARVKGIYGRADLAIAFTSHLLEFVRNRGFLSYIMTNKFLSAQYGRRFINHIISLAQVTDLVDLTDSPVFTGPTTYPCILQVRRISETQGAGVFPAPKVVRARTAVDTKRILYGAQNEEVDSTNTPVSQFAVPQDALSDLCEWIREGSANGKDEVFILPVEHLQNLNIERKTLKPFFHPNDVDRYWAASATRNVTIWPYKQNKELIDLSEFPNLSRYLYQNEDKLRSRYAVRKGGKKFYAYHDPAFPAVTIKPKIVVGDIGLYPSFGLVTQEAVFKNTLYVIIPKDLVNIHFLLSILNSRLIFYNLSQISPQIRGGYLRYKTKYLERLPIRRIDFTTPADERQALVEDAEERYLAYLEHGEDVLIRAFVAARLEAQPEQADVVHDLLAHLAEQMIDMNEGKQAAVEAFWLDLEGVTDAGTFETLRNKGKWESTLWKDAACRPYVDEDSRSTRTLDEGLGWDEEAFKCFVKALAGSVAGLSGLVGVYRAHAPDYRELVARIEATDRLIDQIVYKLYGLTEEEVALVEGGTQ